MLWPDASLYNPEPGRILRALKKAKLTQKEFAKTIGVAEHTVNAWVSGRQKMPYTAQFALESCAVYEHEKQTRESRV